MTATPSSVVIVGASLGGMRTASGLRRLGFEGSIALIGDEDHLPYDRPPLSKEVLQGHKDPADAYLRTPDFFDENGIDVRLGARAVALDPGARAVVVEGGGEVPYDVAVIATGARPRTLPGTEGLTRVHTMRTIDDARSILRSFASASHVVVVGAGFIGSEVAASARSRDLEVTIIEAAEQPLALAVGAEIGARCAALHEIYGTELRRGIGVGGVEEADHGLRVRLSDDTAVDCDAAIVGIGVIPNIEWLETSGIALDRAVICDEYMQTSLPGVYAIGDLASWHNPLLDRRMRVEHWTNTVEQAAAVARSIATGELAAYAGVPYFWSDQYGHRLQLVGSADADEVVVIDDPGDDPGLFALYRKGDRLSGAFGIDRVGAVMRMRGLLLERASYDEAQALATTLFDEG